MRVATREHDSEVFVSQALPSFTRALCDSVKISFGVLPLLLCLTKKFGGIVFLTNWYHLISHCICRAAPGISQARRTTFLLSASRSCTATGNTSMIFSTISVIPFLAAIRIGSIFLFVV